MTALDASFMVDAVDCRRGPSARVRQLLEDSPDVFVTTEACLTEAMYLAGKRVGWAAQNDLWRVIATSEVAILHSSTALVQKLMRRYRDVPMDFADATPVALASEEPQVKIATFDSDFVAYRRDDGSPVTLVGDGLLSWG